MTRWESFQRWLQNVVRIKLFAGFWVENIINKSFKMIIALFWMENDLKHNYWFEDYLDTEMHNYVRWKITQVHTVKSLSPGDRPSKINVFTAQMALSNIFTPFFSRHYPVNSETLPRKVSYHNKLNNSFKCISLLFLNFKLLPRCMVLIPPSKNET